MLHEFLAANRDVIIERCNTKLGSPSLSESGLQRGIPLFLNQLIETLRDERDLIDRSLAEVRLTEGLQVHRERIVVHELIAEAQVAASMAAAEKGIALNVSSVGTDILIDADRQMVSAAIANLLQNAFKFTRHSSHVSLTTRTSGDRVLIEIADECGGLPPGRPEDLFRSFEQRGADRSGLGLGLSISRRSIEANAGKITVRDMPGTGCVFTIDLPKF